MVKESGAVSNATNELLDRACSFAKYMRDAELNAPFQASAAVIMLAKRWRRRARRPRAGPALPGSASAAPAGAGGGGAGAAAAAPAQKNRAYADAAARWRGSIADMAISARGEGRGT